MKRKGFTLIELLAVIVILAIIAVIATPIIVGIIEDSRKAAFERSVEGIIHATDLDFGTQEVLSNNSYTISNGVLNKTLKTPIKNLEGFNGTIKYDEKGNSQYAIHNGKWCMMKDDRGVITIKDYVDGDCELLLPTSESCFLFAQEDYADGTINYVAGTIIDYYDYEDNDNNNPACPRDVVIPNKINGVDVEIIAAEAFYQYEIFYNESMFIDERHCGDNKITSVKFPNSLEIIEDFAFACNDLTGILDLSNTKIKSIGMAAFGLFGNRGVSNQIEKVIFPTSLTHIGDYAFDENILTSVTFLGKNNLDDVTLGSNVWGWADGYSDDDIKFEPIVVE